jgi:hypothetical protein
MSSNKIGIFYHIYQVNNWKEIYKEQMSLIINSGLYDKTEFINIGINGNMILQNNDNKIICNINPNPEKEESDTLKRLKDFAEKNDDYKILYIHTKGVTINSDPVNDWRKYMNYYNIERWKYMLTLLDNYDTVGCNYKEESNYGPYPHFSGNFWWARSEYIKKLDNKFLDSNFRFDREFWIGTGKGNMFEIANSNVNHYTERYTKERYYNGSI